MAVKRVLIVWSEVPEQIASFVVLTVDNETADKLRRFHNQYVNSTGTPDDLAQEMNDFFYGKDCGYFKFKDNIVEGPLEEDFDLIVQCGFIL